MSSTDPGRDDERELERLSPFEIKNRLIELAGEHVGAGAEQLLNAGRGNPNWVATVPRAAFGLLLRFALEESNREWSEWDVLGGMPAKEGIAWRFTAFLETNRHEIGADLLSGSLDYGVGRLGFDAETWVHELTDAVIGDNYPVPDRMLTCVERVVHEYLIKEMCAGRTPAEGPFDLFATEGGTAAMCYVFDSLIVNRLLAPGDTIAIMTPIFTPYVEIPHLERYAFDVVELKAATIDRDGFHTWQYPDAEIDKLADPKVKALFCVNPSNPPSVMLPPAALQRITAIVKERNPGLTVITDDVYGTFVHGFTSLMAAVPRNTIGVYSFSKYFGCTGWRLGVIAVNRDNVFDEKLAAQDAATERFLNERYSTIALHPGELRFIDRLVADSRQVALNHTAGLSTPQQAQMALFALQGLLDNGDEYKHICQSIIARRMNALVKGMGVRLTRDPYSAHYYAELDLMAWAERNWGAEFAAWMRENYEPVDPLFRLAEKASVVLLNGGGFDAPDWSVRVSMANLPMAAYEKIGTWLWEIGQEYKAAFDRRNG